MNLSFIYGRVVTWIRRVFNQIDLTVFGIGLAAISGVLVWIILSSSYIPARYDLAEGDVAPDFINAPRKLTFEDKEKTEELRQQAGEDVSDIFIYDSSVLASVRNDINKYFDEVGVIVASEKAAAQAASQPYNLDRAGGRIRALPEQPKISDENITLLAGLDETRLVTMRKDLISGISRVLESNVTEESLLNDQDRLNAMLQTMPFSEQELSVASEIGNAFLVPNYILDEEKTQNARDQAAAELQPVIVSVMKGETILSPGQVVTDEDLATLAALGLTEEESNFGSVAGIGLLVLVEIMLLVFYINRFEARVSESRAMEFIVASLLVLFALLARVSVVEPLSLLIVPVAALGMIGTLLLRTRLSVILVVMTAAHVAIVGGSDAQFVLVAMLGGVSGVFLVTSATQRSDLFRAGLIAGAVVTAAAGGAGLVVESSLSQLAVSSAWGAANGMLSIIVTMGLLAVYEMTFNIATPMKLLELADPTRPLLKKLMMNAPGTYNHSIIMGNIAETAAEAIGADPLQARVGAYYHDIGKLNRPEYFIENQFHVKNPHDHLTPSLSRLAITAHVRDGVKLAEGEGLPQGIIDIIREHHGTTILSYFYYKARETSPGGEVDAETYRYAGKKPASREAAIIMLADSVEAAVRSLKHPTVRNIQMMIRDIFDQRLRDGQLSESMMTLGDLERVRTVFEKSLQGFGATRIAYPGSGVEAVPDRRREAHNDVNRDAGIGGGLP